MANRYWIGTTSSSWTNSANWSDTSGGGTGASVPTIADDVFFDSNSNGGNNLTITSSVSAKSLTFTGFTKTVTFLSANVSVAGNVTLGSGMTFGYSGTDNTYGIIFTGSGTLISAGIAGPKITVNGSGIVVTLGDEFNAPSRTITVTQGTFDANNYNVTFLAFSSANSNVRTVTMGSGLWTITGTGVVWTTNITTNLTFNKNTANILLSNDSANDRLFTGGGLTFNKLTIGGTTSTSITSINGANSFSEIDSTKTVAHTIRFVANQSTIGVWNVTGSPGNVVTVDSSVAGTRRNFTLTNFTSNIDYLNVTDIGELSGNKFAVGFNSTNGGNNSNVYFAESPPGGVFFLF